MRSSSLLALQSAQMNASLIYANQCCSKYTPRTHYLSCEGAAALAYCPTRSLLLPLHLGIVAPEPDGWVCWRLVCDETALLLLRLLRWRLEVSLATRTVGRVGDGRIVLLRMLVRVMLLVRVPAAAAAARLGIWIRGVSLSNWSGAGDQAVSWVVEVLLLTHRRGGGGMVLVVVLLLRRAGGGGGGGP